MQFKIRAINGIYVRSLAFMTANLWARARAPDSYIFDPRVRLERGKEIRRQQWNTPMRNDRRTPGTLLLKVIDSAMFGLAAGA